MQVTEPIRSSVLNEQNDRAYAELEKIILETNAFLERKGIRKCSTVSEKNRNIFLSRDESQIRMATTVARKTLDVHLEAEKEGYDFDDTKKLLGVALNVLGLSVDSIFYAMIDRNDIVEVYDSGHVQIFRSFNFFRICNYNLDDILAHQWYELYERNESITNQMYESARAHLAGNVSISDFSVPEHLLRERFSDANAVFKVKMKKIATAFSGPERAPAFACSGQVHLVTDPQQLSFLNGSRSLKLN